MIKFEPKVEVMEFFDELQVEESHVNIFYHEVSYSPKEIKELIDKRTRLRESLYGKVELLYDQSKT